MEVGKHLDKPAKMCRRRRDLVAGLTCREMVITRNQSLSLLLQCTSSKAEASK